MTKGFFTFCGVLYTYAIQELGSQRFKNTVYLNFEKDEQIKPYFEMDISPEYLIKILEKYYQTKIIADEILVIFNEIQM